MPFINQAFPPSPPPFLPPARAVPKASWSCFLPVGDQKLESLNEVSPHILAVLDYQKSRHNPDSPSPASSFGFESVNSDERPSEAHPPQDSLPEPGISNITLGSLILKHPTSSMLNPRNLSSLLTENTDEHASHFIVFTQYGTLMGYSDSVKLKLARKISALAGTIWRTNELALYEASQEDDTLLSGFEGEIIPPNPIFFRTLSLTAKENDGRLTSMLLDAGDNMLAAVYSVKHTILVAALVQLGVEETATAAVEPTTVSPSADQPDPIVPSNSDSSPRPNYNSSTAATSDTDISLQDPVRSSSVDSIKSKSTKGKSKESEDAQLRLQRKQVRILNWRAKAMAEALREDLRGFTLPDGAY